MGKKPSPKEVIKEVETPVEETTPVTTPAKPEPVTPAAAKTPIEEPVVEEPKLTWEEQEAEKKRLAFEKEMKDYGKAIEKIKLAFEGKKKAIPTTRITNLQTWATDIGNLTKIIVKTTNTKLLDEFLKFVNDNMAPGKCFAHDEAFSYISVKYPAAQVEQISVTITSFIALAEFYKKQSKDKKAKFNVDIKRIVAITGSEVLGAYMTKD